MVDRKFTFLAFSQFLHHHLLWFLISAYAIAAVYPTVGLWIRNISFGDITIFHEKTHISLLLDDARLTDVQCRAGPKDIALTSRPAQEACVGRWPGCERDDPDGLYFWRHSSDAALV
jgi:hypothetical protein